MNRNSPEDILINRQERENKDKKNSNEERRRNLEAAYKKADDLLNEERI